MIFAMVVLPTLIGLLLAAVLFDFIGKNVGSRTASVLRATYYLPQILPIAVAGHRLELDLQRRDRGALNEFLRSLGVTGPPQLARRPARSRCRAVMLLMVWIQIGYPTVIFMAALQRVDPELYEAAELDGAGWFRRFRAITLPADPARDLRRHADLHDRRAEGVRPDLRPDPGRPARARPGAVVLLVPRLLRQVQGRLRRRGRDGAHLRDRRGGRWPSSCCRRAQNAATGWASDMTTTLTPAVTTTTVTAQERSPPPRSAALVRPAGAVIFAVLMLAPFVLMVMNAFKAPRQYSTGGPLALPTSLYTDGLVKFWNAVDFPRQALELDLHLRPPSRSPATALSRAQRVRDRHRPGQGGPGSCSCSSWRTCSRRRCSSTRCSRWPQSVGLYNSAGRSIIIFTVIQSAFGTYLLACLLGTFPKELSRGGRPGRRELAGACCGRSSSRSSGPRCPC